MAAKVKLQDSIAEQSREMAKLRGLYCLKVSLSYIQARGIHKNPRNERVCQFFLVHVTFNVCVVQTFGIECGLFAAKVKLQDSIAEQSARARH